MPSEYTGMRPREYGKFRAKACAWLDRVVDFVAPHDLSEFVPSLSETVAASSSGTTGLIVLNGGISSGYTPYDLREFLLDAGVVKDAAQPSQQFFYGAKLPFTVVTRPLILQKNPVLEPGMPVLPEMREGYTAASSLLSWARDIAESVRGAACNGDSRLTVSAPHAAVRGEGRSSDRFLHNLLVLPVPPEKRLHKGGSSFNASPTALLLLPCDAATLVATHRHCFMPWVLGIETELPNRVTETVDEIEMDTSRGGRRLLTCKPFTEIPGLYLVPDFLTKEEHDAIWDEMEGRRVNLKCQYLARRRVAHFNRKFIYGVNQLGGEGDDVNAHPSFYEWMRRRLHNEDPSVSIATPYPMAHRDGAALPPLCDQLTANYYDYADGAVCGIAPHVDAHTPFSDYVFIVSLGGDTVLEYVDHVSARPSAENPQKGDDQVGDGEMENVVPIGVLAKARSLLVMSGECRYGWTHCIAERRTDTLCELVPTRTRQTRVSLTWRKGRDAVHTKATCPYPQLCDGV